MFDYERALARLPNWMLLLAILGASYEFKSAGPKGAAGFVIGAAAAWLNFRLIERAVNKIVRLSTEQGHSGQPVRAGTGVRIFLGFVVFGTLAFVTLRFTGFSLNAALLGFLVCPAAALAEIAYELITYGHS
jgi:hypothetical protein